METPAEEVPEARFTIAAIARRTGISVHTLRAWERRYGIPAPARSEGRYRLYGPADLDLIRRMQAAIADGAGAREAAEMTRAGAAVLPAGTAGAGDLRDRLVRAFSRFDGADADRVMTRATAAMGVVGMLEAVVEPALHEIGARWAAGAVGVDVEHFASVAVRTRLGVLIGGTEGVRGRRALLACPPGERHDLPLVCLAVRLRRAGWSAEGLGADLPVGDLLTAVQVFQPALVGISVTSATHLRGALEAASAVRAGAPPGARVLLGGQGLPGDLELPAGVEGASALAGILGRPAGPSR